MSRRKEILAKGEVYHVFNQALDGRNIFVSQWLTLRALRSLWFFSLNKRPFSFSRLMTLSREQKQAAILSLETEEKKTSILAYCLMRNHYHILVRQKIDNGISTWISDWQNSFSKSYNIRESRSGTLFPAFKAVRLESMDQIVNVSRYIHLNPYTGYLVKEVENLKNYPTSSLLAYMGIPELVPMTETREILTKFRDREAYWQYVTNLSDYQKQKRHISHLLFD